LCSRLLWGAPAHDGLPLLRAAPHVVTLALPPINGVLTLLLLLAPREFFCGALGLHCSLTGSKLLLRLDERVGLGGVVLVLLDERRRRC
jgi:hypothetical protein